MTELDMKTALGRALRGLREAQKKTLSDVADPHDYDAGNLSRVERGMQNIAPELLDRIAGTLGVTVSDIYQLAEQITRGQQPDYARLLSLRDAPASYQPTSRVDINVEPGPPTRGLVPLISWVQAGNWSQIVDNFAPGDAEDWLPCPAYFGPRTFALRVRGLSMYNPGGEKSYNDGDIIFVDPDRAANHKSMVVVRLDDEEEATFKQLIIEGKRTYLKALNPAWPNPIIEVNQNATICGVVIGKWVFE